MSNFSPIDKLIRELSKLPGVGTKSASRIAFHILEMPDVDVNNLSSSINDAKEIVTKCPVCLGYSINSNKCTICNDSNRENSKLCVVAKPQDIFVIERSGFRGRYHVLNGLIAPLDGVGPDDLSIGLLKNRVLENPHIEEIVVALNSGVEGDVTTLYLAQIFTPMGKCVSRLARGVPAGACIDYVDDLTLSKAIEERQRI